MGVTGQNYQAQKPVKEFGPKTAFLDTPALLLQLHIARWGARVEI